MKVTYKKHLTYADNIANIGKSQEKIQRTVTELIKIGKGIGLIINSEKINNRSVGDNTLE